MEVGKVAAVPALFVWLGGPRKIRGATGIVAAVAVMELVKVGMTPKMLVIALSSPVKTWTVMSRSVLPVTVTETSPEEKLKRLEAMREVRVARAYWSPYSRVTK